LFGQELLSAVSEAAAPNCGDSEKKKLKQKQKHSYAYYLMKGGECWQARREL